MKKPAAWFEFADNGNIVFWTRDPNAAVLRWGTYANNFALYRSGSRVEASPAIPSGEQWRPIETAPKDGREFLAVNANVGHGFTQVIYFSDTAKEPRVWGVNDAEIYYHRDFFTHWQPLPTPPGSEPIPSLETPDERQAKIVADIVSWLRGDAEDNLRVFKGRYEDLLRATADAIESGDYLRTGGGE